MAGRVADVYYLPDHDPPACSDSSQAAQFQEESHTASAVHDFAPSLNSADTDESAEEDEAEEESDWLAQAESAAVLGNAVVSSDSDWFPLTPLPNPQQGEAEQIQQQQASELQTQQEPGDAPTSLANEELQSGQSEEDEHEQTFDDQCTDDENGTEDIEDDDENEYEDEDEECQFRPQLVEVYDVGVRTVLHRGSLLLCGFLGLAALAAVFCYVKLELQHEALLQEFQSQESVVNQQRDHIAYQNLELQTSQVNTNQLESIRLYFLRQVRETERLSITKLKLQNETILDLIDRNLELSLQLRQFQDQTTGLSVQPAVVGGFLGGFGIGIGTTLLSRKLMTGAALHMMSSNLIPLATERLPTSLASTSGLTTLAQRASDSFSRAAGFQAIVAASRTVAGLDPGRVEQALAESAKQVRNEVELRQNTQQELQSVQQSHQELETRLQHVTDARRRLRQDLERVRGDLSDVRQSHDLIQQERDRAIRALGEALEARDGQIRELQRMKQQNQQLKQDRDHSLQKLNQHIDRESKLQQQLSDATEDLDTFQHDRDRALKELSTLRVEQENALNKLQQALREKEQLANEAQLANSARSSMLKEKDEAIRQISSAIRERDASMADMNREQEMRVEAERQRDNMKVLRKQALQEAERLNEVLAGQESLAEQLQQANNVKESLAEQLQQSLQAQEQVERQVQGSLRTQKDHSKRIAELTQENRQLSQSLAEAHSSRDQTHQELNQAFQRHERREAELRALRTEITQLEQERDALLLADFGGSSVSSGSGGANGRTPHSHPEECEIM